MIGPDRVSQESSVLMPVKDRVLSLNNVGSIRNWLMSTLFIEFWARKKSRFLTIILRRITRRGEHGYVSRVTPNRGEKEFRGKAYLPYLNLCPPPCALRKFKFSDIGES